MPDLARLRSDLAAAVGQPLTDWQAAALALQKRTTVHPSVSSSGQCGGAIALYRRD